MLVIRQPPQVRRQHRIDGTDPLVGPPDRPACILSRLECLRILRLDIAIGPDINHQRPGRAADQPPVPPIGVDNVLVPDEIKLLALAAGVGRPPPLRAVARLIRASRLTCLPSPKNPAQSPATVPLSDRSQPAYQKVLEGSPGGGVGSGQSRS